MRQALFTMIARRFDLDGSQTVVAGVRPAHFRAARASDTVNVIDGDVGLLIEFLGNDAQWIGHQILAGVEGGVLRAGANNVPRLAITCG